MECSASALLRAKYHAQMSKADAFYKLQDLEPLAAWLTSSRAHCSCPRPPAPVTPEVALLPTHPSLHVSTLGREVTSARITQTGRIQKAHGLGANPDSLPCFEILSKLVNYFKLFTDQKNKILRCIGFGTVVRTKTTKD